MKRKSAKPDIKLAERGLEPETATMIDISDGLSRRELFHRAGYSGAALALLPALPRNAQAHGADGRGASGAGGPITPAATLSNSIGFQTPMWGDGANWNLPQYFETIQAAQRRYPKTVQNGDLNGDKREELIARSAAGILVNQYDAAQGQWQMAGDVLPLSDALDWDLAYYYNTIQMADINGDGKAELIARDSDGIIAYEYKQDASDPSKGTWQAIGTGIPPWSDAAGWTTAAYYWTIQCADINGDGQAELIGRAPDTGALGVGGGIHIWRMDKATQNWSEMPAPVYPDLFPIWTDHDGWNFQEYFLTIQCADIDGDGRAELIGRGGDGIIVWKFTPSLTDKTQGTWAALPVGPPFSDAENWNNFQYYSTIQCADIDGDGAAEIIARNGAAIVAYKFIPDSTNPNLGTWTTLPAGPAWDDYHWNAQPYYTTIQYADIDGDGKDELLGRWYNGVNVWKYNPTGKTTGNWTQMPTMGLWSDANGWSQFEYYSTIQTARTLLPGDVGYTGDGKHRQAVLLGRGPLAMQTFRYDNPSGQWIQPSAVSPAWTAAQQTAYPLLSQALDSSDNIRASYGNTMANLDGWMSEMYASHPTVGYETPPAGRPHANPALLPPTGVSQTDWDAVTWQIYWEMNWVKSVNAWFGPAGLEGLINTTGIGNSLQLADIGANYLSIESGSDLAIVLSILALIASAAAAVLSFGAAAIPAAAAVAGVLSASIGIAATSLPSSGGAYTKAYNLLQGDLDNGFDAAVIGNGKVQAIITGGLDVNGNYIPADFGLLRLFGENIQNQTWTWTTAQFNALFLAAQRGYAVAIFQALLAAQPWHFWYDQFTPGFLPDGYPPQYSYPENGYVIWTSEASSDYNSCSEIPLTALSALFDPISKTAWHPLNVSVLDFYNADNGWPQWKWWPSDCGDTNNRGAQDAAPPAPLSPHPDLRVSATLKRDPATGNIVAEVTLVNRGVNGATNVEITGAYLNLRRPLSKLPQQHTRLTTGKRRRITLQFPALTGKAILKIQGRYKGGVFGASLRVNLPALPVHVVGK